MNTLGEQRRAWGVVEGEPWGERVAMGEANESFVAEGSLGCLEVDGTYYTDLTCGC
jgi:hypothetical protein